jgi:hypothetical protein
MPEQPILEVLRTEWFPEKRIFTEVDHSGAKIIAGPPISVDLAEFIGGKCLFGGG